MDWTELTPDINNYNTYLYIVQLTYSWPQQTNQQNLTSNRTNTDLIKNRGIELNWYQTPTTTYFWPQQTN